MDKKTSERGLGIIRHFEGLKLKAYKCPAGVWTIGYGHTKGVKSGQVITKDQATTLMRGDLLPVEKWLNGCGVELKQNEFDALASFAFNLGLNALSGSTLMKKVRLKASKAEIRAEFGRWVISKGKKLPGLVARRKAEADLYTEEEEG